VGDERVQALRAFYRGQLAPELEARADFYHGGQPITRDQVRWDTAGERLKV